MKWILRSSLFGLIAVVAACGSDGSTECGSNGESIQQAGETYCVYRQEVVVENGFECPDGLPFLIEGAGVGICSEQGSIDPDEIVDIRQKYRERDPTHTACQLDSHCLAGDVCLNNECVTPNANNTSNNTNNSNNGTTCTQDSECESLQICSEGLCVDMCGGFGGFECAADEYCDYEPADLCGAADALGICRARPNGCDDFVQEVCGCDGMTYSNECEANSAGQGISAENPC